MGGVGDVVGDVIGGTAGDIVGGIIDPIGAGIGKVGGILGGGSRQGPTMTQTQMAQVPEFLRPSYARAVEEANIAYGGQPLVAGFAPQTEQALQQQEALIGGGAPLTSEALEFARKSIAGEFSPELMQSQFRQLQPGVQGLFAGAGRKGSLLEQEVLARTFGDVALQDLARRQQLALAAPGLEQARFADLDRLARIGALRQTQEERMAQEPFERLRAFESVLTPLSPGATITSQQPTYQNPMAGLLGGALGGGTLGFQIGGPIGGLIGAGAGGLLGGGAGGGRLFL